MDTLFAKHDRLIANTSLDIVREMMNRVHWDARLLSIQGAKGVGKSTLLKQYIKLNYQPGDRKVLYCSADTIDFSRRTLVDLAGEFVMNGGERLIIDEIHKYEGWSREIKEIYDLFPELKVIISGSSLLSLLAGDADLSRRCVKYTMSGLSFREALRFYEHIDLPVWTLEDILARPYELWQSVAAHCKPIQQFKKYLQYGYYPFYLEDPLDYYTRIEQVVNYVVETELPFICKIDVAYTRKIKALIAVIAEGVPYEVNANRLAAAIEIGRDTVVGYLKNLGDAKLLNLLYSDKKSVGKLTKPDKVYLENTNLLYALSPSSVDIGTARETFAITQLSEDHLVEYGKDKGDFKVDSKYRFEIGGKDKGFKQIADLPNSYVFADDIESPNGAKLPLWMLGFLY
ncbi:MAG: ATP-binding protein [Bacteroidales bacterium]|nr:ATP-binding protein [Bacteroidales bacterium]